MMRHLAFIPLLALVLGAGTVSAQYTRHFAPWPVVENGDTLDSPFWGGINNPKPSLVDFNGDGLIDLMLGDIEGRLGYFRNEGTPESPEFVPVAERLGNVDIATWHVLVDIDDDGDLDLFCDSRTATTAYYRNDGGSDSLPSFTFVDSAYADFETGFNNTPAFADIDSDGDYDFFFGATTGALDFYRNTGTAAAPAFVLIDTYYDSVLAFPGGGKSASDPHHGFSAIYFVDLDNDDDLDLFWGDIFNPNLYYFENNGTPAASDLTWVTEFYLLEPTAGFNHPRLADLDNDGDVDMILGVANAADRNNLHLVRNLGSVDQPFFGTETTQLLSMLDLGSFSQPAFGDTDADGDVDLLLGGGDGRIRLYENTGDALTPSFILVDSFLASIDVGLNAAPTLVDWDNDGDLDLLVGTYQGRIQYWRNDGSAANLQLVLVETQLGGIKVDQYAVPRTADFNGDGLTDLVVGEWDFNSLANLRLYANTGALGAPALTLVTESLLPRTAREYTVPEIFDWDDDGCFDIILGGRASGFTCFQGSYPPGTFPDSTTLTPIADTIPGHDAGTYLALRFADIDADGDADVFVGEENGGLSFYEKDGSCCIGLRGNADADSADAVNVGDVTFLVNYLFSGGTAPICHLEANIDADPLEAVNVGDITALINYLFRGADLPSCPG